MREIPLQVSQTALDDPRVVSLMEEWGAELQAVDPGWDPRGGSLVSGEQFVPPRGVFLLAMRAGSPAGCGGLRGLGPSLGEVKRLFVRRPERRRGTGRALLLALEHRAAAIGFRTLRLDTDGSAASVALCRSAGFREIPDYNGNPYARVWMEKELSG